MSLFLKSRLAIAAALGCVSLVAIAAPVLAAGPAAAGKSDPTAGSFSDIRPSKVDKGNAHLPEIKKKRGAENYVPSSKDVIVGWFKELNITHRVDDQNRIILPFRDDASGLNLNLVLIPRMKPNGNMWAVQAVIPVSVPIPAGDAGMQKAINFANTWNTENFLVKVAAVSTSGGERFFLLDAALPCEDGISKQEFFGNFVGIIVQTGQLFAQKAAQAMNAP